MLRTLFLFPIVVLLVLFALSNETMTRFGLWPTDYSVNLPLSLAMLGAMGATFVLGGLTAYVSVMSARRRARRAERAVRALEREVNALQSRLAPKPPEGSLLPDPPTPQLGRSAGRALART
jgi:uncharacterized integral membrane protein